MLKFYVQVYWQAFLGAIHFSATNFRKQTKNKIRNKINNEMNVTEAAVNKKMMWTEKIDEEKYSIWIRIHFLGMDYRRTAVAWWFFYFIFYISSDRIINYLCSEEEAAAGQWRVYCAVCDP